MPTVVERPKRYTTVNGYPIRRFYRREFLETYWRHNAGEHVTFLAPSQNGKTTFAFQLLMYTASPELPAYVLVMKPRDPTPAAWSRHLGFIETPTWPPPKRWPWQQPPAGYTVWPPHTFIVDIDNPRLTAEFKRLLEYGYGRGNCIIFADEIYGMVAELGLTDQLIALWTRGGGMGAGLWGATQRPSGAQGKGVPGFMYSNAVHLFLSKDPDSRSRQRYGEIGGIDPKLVEAAVMKLRMYEFLYIHRGDEDGGAYLAIIEAK